MSLQLARILGIVCKMFHLRFCVWWWWPVFVRIGFFQRHSLSRISNTPRAFFEPAQNLNSGLVEWNCEVVITTTPRRQNLCFKRSVKKSYLAYSLLATWETFLYATKCSSYKFSYKLAFVSFLYCRVNQN